jgi:hypothetical protein
MNISVFLTLALVAAVSAKGGPHGNGGQRGGPNRSPAISGRVQQECAIRLQECAEHMRKFNSQDLESALNKVRESGLREICVDATAAMNCVLNVVLDVQCEPMIPPIVKDITVKSNEAVNFACVERINDFEEHWGCLFNADVDTQLEACENFETALQNCNIDKFVRCAEQTFSASDHCKPGAVDLMRDTANKIINIMPNCAHQKHFSRMLMNFMRR